MMNMVQKGGASIWKTSQYMAECNEHRGKTNAYEANTLG